MQVTCDDRAGGCHDRIVGARTPMRRQLLARVDDIVARSAAVQQAGLLGWSLHAVLTDARVGKSGGHVVALRVRRKVHSATAACPPWGAVRAVALRVVAEEWAVATVVLDVGTAAPDLGDSQLL